MLPDIPLLNAKCFKFVCVIIIPNLFKDSVSPLKTPVNAVVTSLILMFLKEDKSPAKPTKAVDNVAALLVGTPIEVAISPKEEAISKAVPSAIPKVSKVVSANFLTSLEEFLKATSTLFKLSSKSDAILMDAPAIAASGSVK